MKPMLAKPASELGKNVSSFGTYSGANTQATRACVGSEQLWRMLSRGLRSEPQQVSV